MKPDLSIRGRRTIALVRSYYERVQRVGGAWRMPEDMVAAGWEYGPRGWTRALATLAKRLRREGWRG